MTIFPIRPYYAPSLSFALPLHTNYTPELVHYALWALGKMFRPGYRYMKCGVMLTDLIPEGAETGDLFDRRDTVRQSKLMAALDHVNQTMGRRTLFYASSGVRQGFTGASARKSPAYTTDWDSLIQVKATERGFVPDSLTVATTAPIVRPADRPIEKPAK